MGKEEVDLVHLSKDSDLNKLTVVKLKEALTARGLETDGKKAILVERLGAFLNDQKGNR
jgi:hypothetical protein